MLRTPGQVLAAALDRFMDNLGVGEQEVRRTDRVDELPQVELQSALLRGFESFDLRGRFEQRRGPEQIALFDCIKHRVALPIGSREAAVTSLGGNDWIRLRRSTP